jgi:hypothetical protein
LLIRIERLEKSIGGLCAGPKSEEPGFEDEEIVAGELI